MKRWEIYLEFILEVFFIITGLCLIIVGIPVALKFLWPFVVGWIIALLAGPLCNFLEKKCKVSRKWGSFFIVVFSILIIAGVLLLFFYALRTQAMEWAMNLPELYNKLLEQLQTFADRLSQHSFGNALNKIMNRLLNSSDSFGTTVVNHIGSYGVSHAGTIAKGVTHSLIGFIVTLIASYLFIRDREQIIEAYRKIMPEFMKDKISIFCKNTLGVLIDYCIVQLKLMIIIAAILWIGFMILRIPYALLFAVLVSFLDMLPFLGTGTALIPWAIYMAASGMGVTCIGLLILYIICLLFKQIMQPKMLGDRLEMNSLFTLVLMYAGLKLNGIPGFILALIYGIFFTNLYKRGAFDSMINRFKYRFTMLHDLDKKNR